MAFKGLKKQKAEDTAQKEEALNEDDLQTFAVYDSAKDEETETEEETDVLLEDSEEEFDAESVLTEFSDAAKELDKKVTQATTQEELKATLENELKRAQDAEERVLKEIEKEEAKLTPEQKEVVNKLNRNNFTNFWNGVSEGWFN